MNAEWIMAYFVRSLWNRISHIHTAKCSMGSIRKCSMCVYKMHGYQGDGCPKNSSLIKGCVIQKQSFRIGVLILHFVQKQTHETKSRNLLKLVLKILGTLMAPIIA